MIASHNATSTSVGVAITGLTLGMLFGACARARRYRRFPLYGWMGAATLVLAESLMLLHVSPIGTYFTPFAWSAWILVADAAVLALTNRSRLNDAPIVVLRMAVLSVPLWLIFEGYNLRLRNWTYIGVPPGWWGWLGYTWAFATITPAIFETADLVQALLPPLPGKPWLISRPLENILIAAGAACLLLPLILPPRIAGYLFVLVWIGFVLLLDPVNRRLGLPSFIGDLAEGFRRRLFSFALSGWICGWLWEFWNFWASAKWRCIFPVMQGHKIFEMPIPGYFGFLPFALECFAMYVAAAGALRWIRRVKQPCQPTPQS